MKYRRNVVRLNLDMVIQLEPSLVIEIEGYDFNESTIAQQSCEEKQRPYPLEEIHIPSASSREARAEIR